MSLYDKISGFIPGRTIYILTLNYFIANTLSVDVGVSKQLHTNMSYKELLNFSRIPEVNLPSPLWTNYRPTPRSQFAFFFVNKSQANADWLIIFSGLTKDLKFQIPECPENLCTNETFLCSASHKMTRCVFLKLYLHVKYGRKISWNDINIFSYFCVDN